MIPYFQQPSLEIGPITIHAFGVIVALAVFAGLLIGERRFAALGLDRELGGRMAWWIIVAGFLGAHLFAVLFYFPRLVIEDPLVLLRLWEHISSFGGILGGAIGLWLFFRLKAREIEPATRLAYLDVAAFVFPISLMIGRIGCALAHDHPGTVTSLPLAISLESAAAQDYIAAVYADAGRAAELPSSAALAQLGFHDLGLYEALYLGVIVVPAMLLLSRQPRSPGYFLGAFVLMYMPARFLLDFLRVGDVRYAGLTPAQWVALLAVIALVVTRLRSQLRASWIWFALAGAALACAAPSI
jgi:phosphatidylglycerol:prolipoprotein diacylglycerol transferase